MAEQNFTIPNPEGLHARPAAKFVKLSNRFKSEIWVKKGDEEVNGKSIMGLMILAAEQGAIITVSADGPDCDEALKELGALIECGFEAEP
ncbi:MAG: HPr family phosphocarrier protein [Verrucomicrobiales bacterium]|nr:HPr family phosphocarrier protein [Verrucomicrobiales bacterium]